MCLCIHNHLNSLTVEPHVTVVNGLPDGENTSIHSEQMRTKFSPYTYSLQTVTKIKIGVIIKNIFYLIQYRKISLIKSWDTHREEREDAENQRGKEVGY